MHRLLRMAAYVAAGVTAWDGRPLGPDSGIAGWTGQQQDGPHPPEVGPPTSGDRGPESGWQGQHQGPPSPPQALSPAVSAQSYTNPASISHTGSAPPSSPLTNEQQVGNSTWGSLCNPTYPKWLDGNDGPYTSAPWGNKTTKNADSTILGDTPTTNVTRYYDLTVSRGRISADGVLRDVILVNGQFPGPLIEANWGDMIQVTVHNDITEPMEGTSLHWHGMRQKNTSWYDGVPALTQCPIAPGHSFTYLYQAQLYGSSWYHAHYSAQYTAGIIGPMQIYGPTQLDFDLDLGPVMLSDWFHIPYFAVVSDVVGTDMSKFPQISDNNLINGRNSFNCSDPSYSQTTEWLASNLDSNITWTCVEGAALSKFRFQSGKTHRLRLANHGADGVQLFSIDGHNMTVIANDYVPVNPYNTDVLALGVGQRADILVSANSDPTARYWMRSFIVPSPLSGSSSNPQALAAIYYEDADATLMPNTSISYTHNDHIHDTPLNTTQPEFPITPSSNPYQQDLELEMAVNATGHLEWQINRQTYRANFNQPLLFKAAAGQVSFPDEPQWNVYNFDRNYSILLNVTNRTPYTHPFHLHGHNAYILSEGGGVWDGSVVNPKNPLRRDVQIIQGFGYAVFQFEADNPGVFSFHCHVAWHLSGGMAINLITRPEDIPAIPDVMSQTCVDWDDYSNNNVVDQIDAGS